MSKTKTFSSWTSMKTRCLNKKDEHYANYGKRGITICKSWLRFERFYKDMGERPDKKTIDRIDNSKGYYKENCRWASAKEQINNTCVNHLVLYRGKHITLSGLADIANKLYGIKTDTFRKRIMAGWDINMALKTKLHGKLRYAENLKKK